VEGFIHDVPAQRVIFGNGSRWQVPGEVERLGAARILLISGARQRPYADTLADALGERIAARVREVAQHVPVAQVETASAMARERAADLMVSVGGGSATGLAKAVALRTGLPILAVATTYAGSELSPIWGVTESGRKATGRDRAVQPAVAVYDPELTVSLPPAVSAASGMNALAHLVEGLYAPDASPVIRLLAEEGIRALAAVLPRVVAAPTDLEARSDALYGAWLGGTVLGTATMGLHHRICHVLGGAYGLPHGGTHAAVLPFVTAFNAQSAPSAMARVARALGVSGSPAAALHELAARLGAPTSLAQVGFDADDIPEAARLVVAKPLVNPRKVDQPAVRRLLREAHTGAGLQR
jgi:maleylacetate reductase